MVAVVTVALCSASLATDGVACKRAIDDFDVCFGDGGEYPAGADEGFARDECDMARKGGAKCACVTFHGDGDGMSHGDDKDWDCSFMMKRLSAGGSLDCGGSVDRLSAWLEAGSYLTAASFAIALMLFALGAASCASHHLCFRPVTVARTTEASDADDGAADHGDDDIFSSPTFYAPPSATTRPMSFSAVDNFELGRY